MSLYVQVPIQQIADGLTAIGWSSGGGGGDASLAYSAIEPSSPTNGVLWYDTSSETLKMYNGGTWSTVSVSQAVISQIQGYAASSSLASSSAEDAANAAISAKDAIVNMQVATGAAGSSVTWNGATLTVPQGLQGIQGLKGDTGATNVTNAVFTATASQTTFSTSYVVGNAWVYLNGVKLASTDFTATNGTSIVLATGATVGDVVEVVKFSELTNGAYPQLATANTFTAPQRTGTSASTNAIDFRLNNNFTISATAANITVVSLLGCIGQSGVIVIESAENVTGWGAEFNFKTVPTSMNGMEVFSYFVQTETVIRIGRVS